MNTLNFKESRADPIHYIFPYQSVGCDSLIILNSSFERFLINSKGNREKKHSKQVVVTHIQDKYSDSQILAARS